MYMTTTDPQRGNFTPATYLVSLSFPCLHRLIQKIDRKNNYYWIPELRFPTPALDPKGQVIPGSYRKDKFHRDTILDGEIVNDILADGTEQLKFLVFDALIVDNKNLMHRNLSTRLGVLSLKFEVWANCSSISLN